MTSLLLPTEGSPVARPAVEDWNPRRIVAGMLIRSKGNGPDEIVRSVSVNVKLANGVVEEYAVDEPVKVLVDQPVPIPEEDVPDER